MHRSAVLSVVAGLSRGNSSEAAKQRDVKLSKEEDVEYRSGSLYSSSGASSVKIVSKRQQQEMVVEEDLPNNLFKSDTLTVSGSYKLKRIRCYLLSSKKIFQRKRRSADSTNVVESTLRPLTNVSICMIMMHSLCIVPFASACCRFYSYGTFRDSAKGTTITFAYS